MTEQAANDLLKDVLNIVKNYSDEEWAEEYLKNLLEDNLKLITEREEAADLVVRGRKSSFSVKGYNVFLNLHKCLYFGLEEFLSGTKPTSKEEIIKLTLRVIIKLAQMTYIKITDEMAQIIDYLYTEKAYATPIPEILCSDFCINSLGYTQKSYSEAMQSLIDLKTVIIENSNIKLNETVKYLI